MQRVLKKSASNVLAPLSCSRTHQYAPRAKQRLRPAGRSKPFAPLLRGTF